MDADNPKEKFVTRVVNSAISQLVLQLQADLGTDYKIFSGCAQEVRNALEQEVRGFLWKQQMNKVEEKIKARTDEL